MTEYPRRDSSLTLKYQPTCPKNSLFRASCFETAVQNCKPLRSCSRRINTPSCASMPDRTSCRTSPPAASVSGNAQINRLETVLNKSKRLTRFSSTLLMNKPPRPHIQWPVLMLMPVLLLAPAAL